jgi:hypothetical protein
MLPIIKLFYYSSFRLKNHPAVVRVAAPMMSMGQMLAQTTSAGASFKKRPLEIA